MSLLSPSIATSPRVRMEDLLHAADAHAAHGARREFLRARAARAQVRALEEDNVDVALGAHDARVVPSEVACLSAFCEYVSAHTCQLGPITVLQRDEGNQETAFCDDERHLWRTVKRLPSQALLLSHGDPRRVPRFLHAHDLFMLGLPAVDDVVDANQDRALRGGDVPTALGCSPGALVRVPGIILMVPGSVGFRSLFMVFQSDIFSGLSTALSMLVLLVYLVAGLLIGNVLFPPRRTLY